MRKYFLLIFYVGASLLIGKDFHPFSMFPMYSTLPNYAYTFMLTNERGELVFYNKYFKGFNAGFVSHKYFSYFESHKYKSGFGKEPTENLHEAGKEIMGMILQCKAVDQFDFDTLKLSRRFYFMQADTMTYKDYLMYEQAVKP